MSIGALIERLGLAAEVADDRIRAIGPTWAALVGAATGAPAAALGLGPHLPAVLAGELVDVQVGPTRLQVRAAAIADAQVLIASSADSPAPPPLADPIDATAFLAHVGGKPALALEIAAMFRDNLGGALGPLTRAIIAAEPAAIAAEAHGLRGVLVQCAAGPAGAITRAIEHDHAAPWSCLARLVDLHREVRRVIAGLDRYVTQRPA
jgi:hypothetical protein